MIYGQRIVPGQAHMQDQTQELTLMITRMTCFVLAGSCEGPAAVMKAQQAEQEATALTEVQITTEEPSKTAPSDDGKHSRQLWALVGLGWIFMPAWWAGVIEGLRHKRQTRSKLTVPWYICLILSLSAIIILVVVLPVKLRASGQPIKPAEGMLLQ